MGLREKLEKNSALTIAAIVIVVVAAAAYAYMSVRGPQHKKFANSFYFIDEDKTSLADAFPAPMDSIPPIQHEGKQAVRAKVFKVNGTDTVLFLLKATEAGKTKFEATKSGGKSGMPIHVVMGMNSTELLIKKPGDANWVPFSSPEGIEIQKLSRPNGVSLDEVNP